MYEPVQLIVGTCCRSLALICGCKRQLCPQKPPFCCLCRVGCCGAPCGETGQAASCGQCTVSSTPPVTGGGRHRCEAEQCSAGCRYHTRASHCPHPSHTAAGRGVPSVFVRQWASTPFLQLSYGELCCCEPASMGTFSDPELMLRYISESGIA